MNKFKIFLYGISIFCAVCLIVSISIIYNNSDAIGTNENIVTLSMNTSSSFLQSGIYPKQLDENVVKTICDYKGVIGANIVRNEYIRIILYKDQQRDDRYKEVPFLLCGISDFNYDSHIKDNLITVIEGNNFSNNHTWPADIYKEYTRLTGYSFPIWLEENFAKEAGLSIGDTVGFEKYMIGDSVILSEYNGYEPPLTIGFLKVTGIYKHSDKKYDRKSLQNNISSSNVIYISYYDMTTLYDYISVVSDIYKNRRIDYAEYILDADSDLDDISNYAIEIGFDIKNFEFTK